MIPNRDAHSHTEIPAVPYAFSRTEKVHRCDRPVPGRARDGEPLPRLVEQPLPDRPHTRLSPRSHVHLGADVLQVLLGGEGAELHAMMVRVFDSTMKTASFRLAKVFSSNIFEARSASSARLCSVMLRMTARVAAQLRFVAPLDAAPGVCLSRPAVPLLTTTSPRVPPVRAGCNLRDGPSQRPSSRDAVSRSSQ